MRDITWKLTQKQKEANRRAGHWQETGLGDLEPELPDHSECPGPGRLANTSDLEQCSGHAIGHTTHGWNWTVLVS